MLICNVVGARPNFMKVAPIVNQLRQRNIAQILVHTGQHYDANMSRVFFEELSLPEPDIYLGIGSDSHARQTARIMIEFENVCQEYRPDLVIVPGDVNSTLAATLVCAKLHIPVAHVEAGLRSFDRSMPEEVNRILTDHISELLFTTEEQGNVNLRNEGIAEDKIHFVGNCMMDTLLHHVDRAIAQSPWENYGLAPREYALLTLHRPANVDDKNTLGRLIDILGNVSQNVPILFPVHPRTRARIEDWDISVPNTIHMIEPLPYLPFLGLTARAKYVLTDSGGIQQETTALNVPCLTLRETTELPVTLEYGTNCLVGTDPVSIDASVRKVINGTWKKGQNPPLWDGKAAHRIADIVTQWAGT